MWSVGEEKHGQAHPTLNSKAQARPPGYAQASVMFATNELQSIVTSAFVHDRWNTPGETSAQLPFGSPAPQSAKSFSFRGGAQSPNMAQSSRTVVVIVRGHRGWCRDAPFPPIADPAVRPPDKLYTQAIRQTKSTHHTQRRMGVSGVTRKRAMSCSNAGKSGAGCGRRLKIASANQFKT